MTQRPGSHLFEKHTSRKTALLSPSSVGGQEPNFGERLALICKATSCHKDMRYVFPLDEANKLTQIGNPITRQSQDKLYVTNGAVKSSYFQTSYCVCNGLYLLAYTRECNLFLFLQSLIRLCVMHITFKFNSYSLIKVFSFSTAFVESISGLVEDFVLIIFLQHHTYLSHHPPPPFI